jgi:hypothetical protein
LIAHSYPALSVFRTLLSTLPEPSTRTPDRPFVFISAESIFSPLISPRYVETKRQAEQGIERLIWEYKQGLKQESGVRGVYVRPGQSSVYVDLAL